MAGSAWWLESGPTPIDDDPDTATLIIRLQLALNALDVQGETVPRLTTDLPEGSPVRMRSVFLALLSYAAYTKEAINILTGTKQAQGEFQRVLSLARRNQVPPSVVKKVRRICAGGHPACAVLTKMRNELGFHWDPTTVRAALSEFARNESVIWIESAGDPDLVVHRLAIDVAALALFPESFDSGMNQEERIAVMQTRITRALTNLGDAGEAVLRFFHHAVIGYLRTIGAERKTAATSENGK